MIGITAAILVLKDSGCLKERNHFDLEVECLSIFSSYCGDFTYFISYIRIVESRNPDFPVGKLVCSTLGWRTKSVVDVNKPGDARLPKPYLLPDFQGLPASLGVGFLGMPG
uniref:Uncharacterized protein n=1 Tax=Timema poppense TaxID=170557 RepID=A0A7R9GWL4_TIMPO|nr:unnamed protein product [Timema poppensis]